MKKLLSTLFISTALLFVGCEGDEGPQGPAGPAGADGNANVKTEKFTVQGATWSDTTTATGTTYTYNHNTSLLTQEILDNGLIHVYLQGYRSNSATNERVWIELPFSGINYYPHLNQLEVTSSVNLTSQETPFKLITVEGNLVSNSKIDFSNYEEVKAHFDLQD